MFLIYSAFICDSETTVHNFGNNHSLRLTVWFFTDAFSFPPFNHQDDTQSAATRWESLIAVQESTSVSDWMHAGVNFHKRKKCPNLKR